MIKKHQVDTDLVKQYKDVKGRSTLSYDIDRELINRSAESHFVMPLHH